MEKSGDWTFLSNYGHVLVYISTHPEALVREVAEHVGITERSAMRIITQLDEAGVLSREKSGRRNLYTIDRQASLRHPVEANCTVGRFLDVFADDDGPTEQR
ncbi:MAG: AsnC family transcriptional regulator [Pseudomonadota bacterium]